MGDLNIAVIGAGWIGRIHCECYRRLASIMKDVNIKLYVVSDILENAAIDAMKSYGFSKYTTSWEDAVNDGQVDVIDICVDNMFHKEIAVKAAERGKHIICEKPLATGIDDAAYMVETVKQYNVKNAINFNYRKVPAVAFIKAMIAGGELGEIYHVKGMFQQDFGFDSPMTWRFKKSKSGGGSIVTMGSHLIDLGRFLVGDYKQVSAADTTFIKERVNNETKQMETCDVDDAFMFISKFENGAIGMFLTSWISRGRKHHCEIEIFGSKGSVYFNSERLNEIGLFINTGDKLTDGIRNVLIGDLHPNGSLFELKTGMGIGIKESFIIQLYDFIKAIVEDRETTPDFYDGLMAEKVSQAVLRAADEKAWVSVKY